MYKPTGTAKIPTNGQPRRTEMQKHSKLQNICSSNQNVYAAMTKTMLNELGR